MNALTIFIRRPVLASMLTLLLLVLGVFSLRDLGVDLMPKIDVPVVTVTTTLRGASPEEIESQITKPIEEAVNTVSGIDELTSVSYEGMSRVVIRFLLDRPMAEATQDVRDKVATVLSLLPEGTDPPVVARVDFDAYPVMTLTVSGPRDLKEISEVARLTVKEALESVDGVGSVTVSGQRKRAINVVLDIDRLRSYGIPIGKVKAALAAQNVEIPSGRIDRGASEQVLRTLARIEKVPDFAKIIVAEKEGRQITLGDLGRVEDSIEEPRTLARVWNKGDAGNGDLTVSLDIVKQSGTNTVDVIDNVKKRVEQVRPILPEGYRINLIMDQSDFIKRSLHELKLHLLLGALFAALSVLFFMRDFRSTIIAAVAIPTSLVSTFILMRALHFTLNNMSLLGLTLAVGVVLDDAIVVLENIYRHMDRLKKEPLDAAIDGLKEIGLAVMATTTSLIVIFLPVAFMQGMTGRFFYEFGLTTAFAIGVSLLISFTLTPMLSSRFLKVKKGKKDHGGREWLPGRAYIAVLRLALRHRPLTILICVAVLLSTVPLVQRLGKDFMPLDDRNEFEISLIAPAGSSLDTVDRQLLTICAELRKLPGVEMTLTRIGSSSGAEDVTQGGIYIRLVDLAQREYSQFDVMRKARAVLARFPEVRSSVNAPGGFSGGSRRTQLQYNLNGPDLEALRGYANGIVAELRKIPGYVDLDTSLTARQPEIRVVLDRPRAADLGISAADVASSLRTMVGGEIITKYREGVEQYDVWLRLDRKDRSNADIIEQLPLLSSQAGLVPLSQVSKLEPGQGPTRIDRFNRQRLVTVYGNLDGVDLGSTTERVAAITAAMKMPPAYKGVFMGQGKMMAEALGNFLIAFGLAFIFMYIVLAAQFESFLHPVTILLSLPLTLPFAFLSLFMLHETLNLYSVLGVFMLFGIVKKNGILQIDYTNTLLRRGMPLDEAILDANRTRLRPILMTTFTLVFGMSPIALGTGPGAAARASVAKVIIGGQALSLFITLIIVPVAYSLFEGAKKHLQIGIHRRPA